MTTTTNTTHYEITTGSEHGDATDRPWMKLPSTTIVACSNVGWRCSFTVQTTDRSQLEAALESDDDVIEYQEVKE